MNLLELCTYIYTIYCTILVYLSLLKSDCFIVVALKAMLNTADNGYQGHPLINVTYRIIYFQQRVAVCIRTP